MRNSIKLLKFYTLLLLFTGTILLHFPAYTQWTGKAEAYKYIGTGVEGSLQPLVHIQTPGNWYGEMRYNYEEARTLSFYAGKTFAGGKSATYTITPIAGYSTGIFTGLSLAVNTDVEWKRFYFSAQSQYSISTETKDDNFLFSWSELGYSISDHFFTGFSLQYTRTTGQTYLEPGIVTGLSFNNVEIPIYLFKPFQPGRYVVLGLSYEFTLGKKRKGLSLADK
jgi:hypothetical protein